MVFSYYVTYIPYNIIWHIMKLFRSRKSILVHIEDSFDYFLFGSIAKYLAPMNVVITSRKIITPLKQYLKPGIRIYRYPLCFPDAVIMFRNAAWKYPVRKLIKIGLEHGAYNFKRFPRAEYYNLFDLYLMTSHQDVKRLKSRGVRPVKAIGYPKSDKLFDGTYSEEVLFRLRDTLQLIPALPVILFSSTWDGSGMSAIDKWYNQLHRISDKYNILVTIHPRMSDKYRNYLRNLPDIHYIEDIDIYPFLLLCDVCIGDTNSLIAEFCIVNRPIITFTIEPTKRTMDDVIELIKSISIRIDDFNELPAAIDLAIGTAQETAPARTKAIQTLIDPLDGKAGERASEAIIKLIPELKL